MDLLVVSDSFGTDYGAVAYVSRLRDMGVTVTHIAAAGRSSGYALEQLDKIQSEYDAAIIQLASADLHPRVPKQLTTLLTKLTRRKIGDSSFSVPPVVGIRFVLKLPLFIIRLVLIRLFDETIAGDNYSDVYDKVVDEVVAKCHGNIIIIPAFCGAPYIYSGRYHDHVEGFNQWIAQKYPHFIMDDAFLDYQNYKSHFLSDWFHLDNAFHKALANALYGRLNKMVPAKSSPYNE